MPKHFIRNFQRETQLFNSRVYLAMLLIGITFSLLLVRLFYLQVVKHDTYSTLSDQNSIAVLPLPPNRGLIYDRSGILLANNIPTFSIHIVPEQTENLKETIKTIQSLIEVSEEDIDRFYKEAKRRRQFEGVPLLLNISEDDAAVISINTYRLPGVNVVGTLMREYPQGTEFSHLIGYVGRINEDELKTLDPEQYRATLYMGKTGLEKYYENKLHGETGYQKVETDARGRVLRVLETHDATPGANLYLSIDSRLQIAAGKAFDKGRGAVVAIEPQTGELLAFVAQPGFDPNVFVRGINHADYKALSTDINQPLYNRALRGLYPPASTVKPIIALQALEKNIVTPQFSIWDPGFYQLGGRGRQYRDWETHGRVDLHKAIQQSCDVYFYIVSNNMGIRMLAESLKMFGYGERTGVDIHGETAGLVPTPEWKKGRHGQVWFPGETLSTGIGQGYMQTTPVQMAHAIATLANRGIRLRPHAVATIGYPDGRLENVEPETLKPVEFSAEHWDQVTAGMLAVVQSDRGTARYISNNHYTVAGKTGTAQVFNLPQNAKYRPEQMAEHLRDHSLFIGYAPADNPTIAVAVVLENKLKKSGAMLAKDVFDAYLVPPEVLAAEAQARAIAAKARAEAAAAAIIEASAPEPPIAQEEE